MAFGSLQRAVFWVGVAAVGVLVAMPAEGWSSLDLMSMRFGITEPSATAVPGPTRVAEARGAPVPAPPLHRATLQPSKSVDGSISAPPEAGVTAGDASEAAGEEVVSITALNVRSAPSASSPRLYVLRAEMPVHIEERQGGWIKVSGPDGEGWVYGRYLADPRTAGSEHVATAPSEAGGTGDTAPPTYARLSGMAELHASPSRSAQPLLVLDGGARVAILDQKGRWLHVTAENGVSGWVRTQ